MFHIRANWRSNWIYFYKSFPKSQVCAISLWWTPYQNQYCWYYISRSYLVPFFVTSTNLLYNPIGYKFKILKYILGTYICLDYFIRYRYLCSNSQNGIAKQMKACIYRTSYVINICTKCFAFFFKHNVLHKLILNVVSKNININKANMQLY